MYTVNTIRKCHLFVGNTFFSDAGKKKNQPFSEDDEKDVAASFMKPNDSVSSFLLHF